MSNSVDIVYTWVDSEDIVWRKKRESACKISFSDFLEPYSNVDGRFRNNDELKYSLRSLEPHLKNFRNIYIVTDNHRPQWLRGDSRIKIIDHTEIIPHKLLPTFSSKKIELFLHCIPGISDVFMYMNDDIFLGPIFVVDPSKYYLETHDTHKAQDFSYMFQDFFPYEEVSCFPSSHAPRYINKYHFREFLGYFGKYLNGLSGEVFRDSRNPSVLDHLFYPWAIKKGYVNLVSHENLHFGTCDIDVGMNYKKLLSHIDDLDFFSINDTCDNKDKDCKELQKLKVVLDSIFPYASSFEM